MSRKECNQCDCERINNDKMDIETHDGSEFRIKIEWCSKCESLINIEEY